MDHKWGLLGILCLLKQWWPSLEKGSWLQWYFICSDYHYFQSTFIWRCKQGAQEPIKLLNPVSGSAPVFQLAEARWAQVSLACLCLFQASDTMWRSEGWGWKAVQPELCTQLGFSISCGASLCTQVCRQGLCSLAALSEVPMPCWPRESTLWCPMVPQLLAALQHSVMGSGVLLAKPYNNSCRWELEFPIAL